MDSMVLLPAEGVEERETRPGVMPWLERRQRGMVKAFFATIWLAMIRPGALIRGVPRRASVGEAIAFGFLVATFALTIGGALPLFGYWAVGFGMWGFFGLWELLWYIFLVIAALLGVAGFIPLWALATHAALRITGGAKHSLDRTFQAIGYSGGANGLTAVPCLGPYLGWIWWLISAGVMVKEAQQVHAGRAALAVLALPVALVFTVGGGAGMLAWWMPGLAGFSYTDEAQVVTDSIVEYADSHGGSTPRHAAELLLHTSLSSFDLIAVESDTFESQVPLDDINLEKFSGLPSASQRRSVQSAMDGLPQDTIAHRLGDFVFTFHGIDVKTSDVSLWLLVMVEDPDARDRIFGSKLDPIWVGTAGGEVLEIARNDFLDALQEQNALRKEQELAPLPDLVAVTHDKPAVAQTESGAQKSEDGE